MKLRITMALLALAAVIVLVVECCKPTNPAVVATEKTYVGSATCQNCHQQEHAQWLTSHHYKAMLPANDTTVAGNFDNAVYKADGVTSTFFKKDGKFYINTQGEDGQYRDFEVQYVFGYEPLQQYLVAFPGGRMQATRASWDTKSRKWFHQYPGDKIPAGDWLHWTGNGQNWNTMCASCHSTNLKKGYDIETGNYQTTYNEINVSCESCHGPGSSHVAYASGNDYKEGKKIPGSLLEMHRNTSQQQLVNTCGYCHARRTDISETVPVQREVMQDYIPELPTTDYFYADGQMDDEDYNYTSFLQSKMFRRGVQCTHCHNPHSGKLKLDNTLVCSQCHASDKYAVPSHTMHDNAIESVNCITCHMPSKIYMGNDLRHDHSFRIPRPDLSAKYGTPNTCNSCHNGKTAQWAAQQIEAHYGSQRTYHFAEDLVPGSLLDDKSLAHLKKLLADSAVPDIVRATAANYAGRISEPSVAGMLTQYAKDTSALVRYAAIRSLMGYSPQTWMNAALPLLQDQVKAIRIAAADLFNAIPATQIPGESYTAYNQAKTELERFLFAQADFAQGSLQVADYFSRRQDYVNAEKFYKMAIAKDSQLTIARINYASALNALQKNEAALQQLEIAVEQQPNSDHVYYTLGLLNAEMGRIPQAKQALQKAVTINSGNVRAQYNYGLLLQQEGNPAGAESAYKAALKVAPTDGDVLNALIILYLQQNKMNLAMPYAQTLRQYHGNNPAYSELLRRLRL